MNTIDQSIFKAYDIRGIYPEQIDADLVYKIAQAYAKFIGPKTVIVGHDMRLSGEEFSKALIAGLTDAGVDVIDIGLVSTDTLYFAAAFLGADGGIQVTASHNPKEYGGLKMVREKGYPISGDTGIYEIRDMVLAQTGKVLAEKKGTVEKKDVTKDYFTHVLKTFDLTKIKPLTVVANTNFGMAGAALPHLQAALPIQFLEILNGTLDGNFPKGRPDPLVLQNREEIILAIKQKKPDVGVAWDADADRCFFFDELGNFVTPAYASALMAEYYLKKNPGAKILHDTRVVRVIDAVIEQNGGQSVINKAGHSFIKERMIKDDIVFGCETSGHYFFKDNYYLDNGLFPFLCMLEILSSAQKPFSKLLAPLREKFFISEEINTKVSNAPAVMEALKTKYADATIDSIDGYDFNYKDWRFNIRTSNTEPLLRLNVESSSQELLSQKTKEITDYIQTLA